MKKSGSDSCLTRRRKKTGTVNDLPSGTGQENLDHATTEDKFCSNEKTKRQRKLPVKKRELLKLQAILCDALPGNYNKT